jgi:hypothetical protein
MISRISGKEKRNFCGQGELGRIACILSGIPREWRANDIGWVENGPKADFRIRSPTPAGVESS